MRNPKSQSCTGNADLINELIPWQHGTDRINQALSHRQADTPLQHSLPAWRAAEWVLVLGTALSKRKAMPAAPQHLAVVCPHCGDISNSSTAVASLLPTVSLRLSLAPKSPACDWKPGVHPLTAAPLDCYN